MATAGEGEPAANKVRGLLRRAENLYRGLPAHHQMLRGELDRDRAELDDMLANPPGPFEHAGALADKQAQLAALSLELRLAAESPEALAKAAAANQRITQLESDAQSHTQRARRAWATPPPNRCAGPYAPKNASHATNTPAATWTPPATNRNSDLTAGQCRGL